MKKETQEKLETVNRLLKEINEELEKTAEQFVFFDENDDFPDVPRIRVREWYTSACEWEDSGNFVEY